MVEIGRPVAATAGFGLPNRRMRDARRRSNGHIAQASKIQKPIRDGLKGRKSRAGRSAQPIFDQRISRCEQAEEHEACGQWNDPCHQRAMLSHPESVPSSTAMPEQITDQLKGTAKRDRRGFEQSPWPGRCFTGGDDDDEKRGRQRGHGARTDALTCSIRASRPATNIAAMTIRILRARMYAITGDAGDAEHRQKQRQRNAHLPAEKQPVGQRDTTGGEQQRLGQRARGSGSDFDIGRGRNRHGVHFPEVTRVRWRARSLGLDLAWRLRALRKGDHRAAGERRFQPPAVPQQPPRQSRSHEADDDDFPHDPSMGAGLAGLMCGMIRKCGLLCRFCAGAGRHPGRAWRDPEFAGDCERSGPSDHPGMTQGLTKS